MRFFEDEALSRDAFLGGRVTLMQPKSGYRAGIDPVILAAAVPAHAGQSVLDLGCGAGAAVLCLGARVAGLELFGVERQTEYAELARRNSALNEIALTVLQADLAVGPMSFSELQFDHVIANPPYFRDGAHSKAKDAGRAGSMGETNDLSHWIDVAARRLSPRGFLHVIQRTDRLPDILSACSGRLGSIEVLPISARSGQKPNLVLLRARKSGRAAFQLHVPKVLHLEVSHTLDKGAYHPEINSVLRDAAALIWPKNKAKELGGLTGC
ncbi:MAG: tRNA1(Val) (adenine(37)-N6)-methyltransferase [Sedimentitalea sp.]